MLLQYYLPFAMFFICVYEVDFLFPDTTCVCVCTRDVADVVHNAHMPYIFCNTIKLIFFYNLSSIFIYLIELKKYIINIDGVCPIFKLNWTG